MNPPRTDSRTEVRPHLGRDEAPLGDGASIGGRRQGRECRLDQQLLLWAERRVPGSAADSKTKVTQIRLFLLTTPTPTWRKGE